MTARINNDYSVILTRFFLAWCGLNLNKNDRFLIRNSHLNFVIWTLLINCFICTDLFVETNMSVIWQEISNLMHVFSYTVTYFLIWWKKNLFELLLSIVKSGIYSYPNDMLVFIPQLNSDNSKLIKLSCAFLLEVLLIFLAPIITHFFGLKPPSKYSLMYFAWYPWSIDTQVKYIFTYILQITGGLFTACFFPLNCLFLICFILIVRRQLFILLNVLRNIHSLKSNIHSVIVQANRSQMQQIKMLSRLYDDRYYYYIIQCVKHHAAIIRFIKVFVTGYRWIFVAALLYSLLIFTFNCYLLITDEFVFHVIVQRIIELLWIFSYLFIYCYIGEVIKDVNTTFLAVLYEIKWYNKPLRIQNLVQLALTITCTEIKMNFGPNSVASFVLFASVIRISYTYANILIKIHSKVYHNL